MSNKTEVQYEAIARKLETRRNDYGDYLFGVKARAKILGILNEVHAINNGGTKLTNTQIGMFYDVVNKLVRLATTPEHRDSWLDVIGYSNCILNSLTEREAQ